MKTLVSNYTLSGNTVTLGGVNAPQSNLLFISDATSGKLLYSPAGPTLAGYSTISGGNAVATLSSTPASGDLLTIFYDNGIAPTNAPSTVTLGGSNITVPVSLNEGRGTNATLPVFDSIVGGTVTLGSGSSAIGTVGVSSLPALPSGANSIGSVVNNGGTVTLAAGSAAIGSVSVSNFPATQTVSGTVTANTGLSQPLTDTQLRASAVPVSGTFYPATQPVSATSLPLPTGAAQDGTDGTGITAPTGGSGIRGWLSGIYQKLSSALAVTQSGTWTIGRTWNLASGSDSVTATISGTVPVSGTFYQATQPVSGSVSVLGGNATAVKVDGSAVTQPVSGSVSVLGGNVTAVKVDGSAVTQPVTLTGGSLTLTSTTNPVLGAGSSTIGSVSLIGGNATAVKVDGSAVTQPVSGSVSVLGGNATAVKVDGSAVTQPVSGTVTLGSGTAIIGAVQQGSGTLTMSTGSAGTASATISFSPTPSKYLRIDNNSSTATLYVSTTTPATSTNSVIIGNTTTAKSFWEPRFVPTNTLYILASAASTPYTLTYA